MTVGGDRGRPQRDFGSGLPPTKEIDADGFDIVRHHRRHHRDSRRVSELSIESNKFESQLTRTSDSISLGPFLFILKVSCGYGEVLKKPFRESILVSRSGETSAGFKFSRRDMLQSQGLLLSHHRTSWRPLIIHHYPGRSPALRLDPLQRTVVRSLQRFPAPDSNHKPPFPIRHQHSSSPIQFKTFHITSLPHFITHINHQNLNHGPTAISLSIYSPGSTIKFQTQCQIPLLNGDRLSFVTGRMRILLSIL